MSYECIELCSYMLNDGRQAKILVDVNGYLSGEIYQNGNKSSAQIRGLPLRIDFNEWSTVKAFLTVHTYVRLLFNEINVHRRVLGGMNPIMQAIVAFVQGHPHQTLFMGMGLLTFLTGGHVYVRHNLTTKLTGLAAYTKIQIESSIQSEKKHAFQKFLLAVKQMLNEEYQGKPPAIKCYISYAWETEDNMKLQAPLNYLRDDLSTLGCIVFYDMFDMDQNMRKKMEHGIKESQHVFFIGTKTLNNKITNMPDSNIAYEWNLIKEEATKKQNFIFPILYSGNSSDIPDAFPPEVHALFIRQGLGHLDYHNTMGGIASRGIILGLFQNEQNKNSPMWKQYEMHWEIFTKTCQTLDLERKERMHDITSLQGLPIQHQPLLTRTSSRLR